MILSLILTACTLDFPNRNPESFPDNPLADFDGDGFTEQTGDCDDLDPELGQEPTWYLDSDGDGYGDLNVSQDSCTQPEGYVSNSDDCDDGDADTYPGSSQDGALLCVRDEDGDGYGDSAAGQPFDAGTDCNDSDASIFPGNAREEGDLCVVDADGDGYGATNPSVSADFGSDCDDSDASVYPGRNKEQGNLCVLDSDGDGYGDLEPPLPYEPGTDCDDSDAFVSPEAQEICDEIDNDCDGNIDDNTDVNTPTWYMDADGDGFGRPADADGDGEVDDANGDGVADNTIRACVQPQLYSDNGFDCDDTRADVYPNAPELCVDGDGDGDGLDDAVDNDCDGIADEAGADDVLIWYADADSDGFGNAAATLLACEQPAGYISDNTDCNDNNVSVYPGASEYCNQVDDDCDGTTDEEAIDTLQWYSDSDGDGFGTSLVSQTSCVQPVGFVADGTDCDDTTILRAPNAIEFCNGLDDDCDGDTDELAVDSSYFYIDVDNDGYGEPSESILSCPTVQNEPPQGYSPFSTDCDDNDANRSPGLPELCTDDIDENCDGNNILGAVDLITTWWDFDGDGFGNVDYPFTACVTPIGYADNDQDCNDSDAEVRPDILPEDELCNGRLDSCQNQYDGLLPPIEEIDEDGDGYVACILDVQVEDWLGAEVIVGDSDCNPEDGSAFPGHLSNESDPNGCYSDVDGDGWGDSNPPPKPSVVNYDVGQDCEDDKDWVYPAAPEECNGIAEDCTDPNYGSSPDLEFDDDGDGFVECVDFDPSTWVGAQSVLDAYNLGQGGGGDCNDGLPTAYPGAAYVTNPNVCLNDIDGDGIVTLDWSICAQIQTPSDALYTITGEADWDFVGMDVADAGDVDGDGLSDLLVGATEYDQGPGKVGLFLGSSLGSGAELSFSNADYIFEGGFTHERVGTSLSSLGDIDGNGKEDFIIGASTRYNYGLGAAYVILGESLTVPGVYSLSSVADYTFEGVLSGTGISVLGAGDIDGGGQADFLIGSRDSSSSNISGAVYVFYSENLGSPGVYSVSTADVTLNGESNIYDLAGASLGAGDIDGDGLPDLLIGAPSEGDTRADHGGRVYLIYASTLQGLSLSTMNLESDADLTFEGLLARDMAGTSVAALSDIDGDGKAEILLGSTRDDGSDDGKAHLFLSSSIDLITSTAVSVSESDYTFTRPGESFKVGAEVGNIGDIDGDGLGDFYIADNNDYASRSSHGYLMLGNMLGSDTDFDLAMAAYLLEGDQDADAFGASFARIGDINGDGFSELALGARFHDAGATEGGQVSVFGPCDY